MKNTGLLGGTFDPIHLGHLELAELALKHAGLDEVVLIPSRRPPHKDEVQTSFSHRLAMTRLAVQGRAGLSCSDIEGRLAGPSYTLNTVRFFEQKFTNHRLHLVIGLDTFMELDTWFSWQELLECVGLVVAGRADYSFNGFESKAAYLGFIASGPQKWQNQAGRTLNYLARYPVPVSSTSLRKMLAQGGQTSEYIDKKVMDYISFNKLYGRG